MAAALKALVVAGLAMLALCAFPAIARAGGVLYLASDPGQTFPLTRTEVTASVAGDIVSTRVTQRFQNTFKERIEVVYVFPLPNHAAVDDMEMHLGKRVVRAEIK